MGLFDFLFGKTIDTDIKNHTAKIIDLINLGIDFNWEFLGDEKSGLLCGLRGNSIDNDSEYWIVLREMGRKFRFRTDNTFRSAPYSKNVSTIIYEDYLRDNKLSYIFEEFNRITNGKINFQVIDEFNPLQDATGKENDPEFWNYSEYVKGNINYLCKYLINGKFLEIEYCFSGVPTYHLNGDFIIRLIKALKDIFLENDISFVYPDMFITFFICDKQFRPNMGEYLGTYFESLPTERK